MTSRGYFYTSWKKYFAWYPVLTEDEGLVWFKMIWSKENLWVEGRRLSVVVPLGENYDNHIENC